MLPLRPSPPKNGPADSLFSRIIQINQQKGSFRNVTEQSLIEDINSQPTADEDVEFQDVDGEGAMDESPDDREKRLENLYKGREEILRQIDTARNDAYSALDFVSLLLTKHNSRQAEASMSPFLKQNIPLGTLEPQKGRFAGPSAAEKRKIELVSAGWKVESLGSSAEHLLGAASRLQKEAARESKYWEQVSRIRAKGWAVSRVPQERHTLGVRFGFPEASLSFRNKGFAALRSKDDGDLYLDRGAYTSKHRSVKVTILENGREIGASSVPADTSVKSEAIEDEILQARNSLFEEELFHEANREATSSASLEFVTDRNLISFALKGGTEVQIRLVKLTQDVVEPATQWPSNDLAEGIALSLRILLSHAHRKNHERRTRPPPPLTTKQRPVPEYPLLRPVFAFLQHRENVQDLDKWITEQLKTLSAAGFVVSSTVKPFEGTELPSDIGKDSQTTVTAWIDSLTARLESSINIQLPSSRILDVKIRSLLSPPILGTEFTISEVLWQSVRLPASRQPAVADCKNSLSQTILQDVVSAIESVVLPLSHTGSTTRDTSTLRWVSERPFSSNFGARVGLSSNKSQLQLQFSPSAFLLRYVLISADGRSPQSYTYVWTKDGQIMKETGGKREAIEHTSWKEIVEESLTFLEKLL